MSWLSIGLAGMYLALHPHNSYCKCKSVVWPHQCTMTIIETRDPTIITHDPNIKTHDPNINTYHFTIETNDTGTQEQQR